MSITSVILLPLETVTGFGRAASELQPTSSNDMLMTICVFASIRKCREQRIASRHTTQIHNVEFSLQAWYTRCAIKQYTLPISYSAVFLWKRSAENECSSKLGCYKKCDNLKVHERSNLWRWNFLVSAKQTSLEYAVSVTSWVNGLGHINTDRNTQRKLIDLQVMFQDIDPGRVGYIPCPCRL